MVLNAHKNDEVKLMSKWPTLLGLGSAESPHLGCSRPLSFHIPSVGSGIFSEVWAPKCNPFHLSKICMKLLSNECSRPFISTLAFSVGWAHSI